jgi:hypothetical protein
VFVGSGQQRDISLQQRHETKPHERRLLQASELPEPDRLHASGSDLRKPARSNKPRSTVLMQAIQGTMPLRVKAATGSLYRLGQLRRTRSWCRDAARRHDHRPRAYDAWTGPSLARNLVELVRYSTTSRGRERRRRAGDHGQTPNGRRHRSSMSMRLRSGKA